MLLICYWTARDFLNFDFQFVPDCLHTNKFFLERFIIFNYLYMCISVWVCADEYSTHMDSEALDPLELELQAVGSWEQIWVICQSTTSPFRFCHMVYVRRLHGFCLSVMKQLHQLHVKGVFAQHGRCCNVNFIQHRDQDFFFKKKCLFFCFETSWEWPQTWWTQGWCAFSYTPSSSWVSAEWDYTCVSRCLVYVLLGMDLRASCVLGKHATHWTMSPIFPMLWNERV